MTRIVLATHGEFCRALLDTARMIAGDLQEVIPAPLLPNASLEEYLENLQRLWNLEENQETVFLCDLAGGTPYNSVIHISGGRLPLLLAGLSLPMLLSAAELREEFSGEELVQEIRAAAVQSVRGPDLTKFVGRG